MTSKNYNKKNYVFLYRGLLIVRDALLEYVVNSLKNDLGIDWWKISVEPAFRSEDMEKLKVQFQKRFSSPDGPSRPGTELHEILDLNYFGNVIEYNWKKVFSKILNNDRTLLVYIKEIVTYRNPVAHTETGDLHDDDAFRGLDTGDRLLRLINKSAADEVGKIKNEMRSAWIYDEIGLGTVTPEKVGISIEKGFERLEDAVNKSGVAPDDINLLSNLKQTLFSGITTLREQGNSQDVSLANQLAFDSLQKLSQKYLAADFSAACLVFAPLPKSTPKEVTQKTLAIQHEIDVMETDIKNLELDLEFQKNIGLEQRQFVLQRIVFKKQLLQARQNDLEKIQKETIAPVFFSISRNTETAIREETPFVVHVEVKNLGTKKTIVSYQEGFSPDVIIVDGETGFNSEIEPNSIYAFSYTCLCSKSGKYTLFTNQLDYEEKLGEWDIIQDTIILALPGKGPRLEGKRYYRFAHTGMIDILIQLENYGDKTAQSVCVQDVIFTKNKGQHKLFFQGDLKPKEKISINCTLRASEISEINLPEISRVLYHDNNDQQFSLDLTESFSLLEYSFPQFVEVIGRKSETEQVEKTLRLVSGLSIQGQLYLEKRIILLEGVAGIGKSRFIYEAQKIASEKYNFQVSIEDVSSRSSVKRILRNILGLDVKFTTKDSVWNKLNEFGPNNFFRQRDVLARFLASDYEKFEEFEVQDLIIDILLIIRYLCQRNRYLLIFENAHEFSEGLELTIFQKIMQYASETQDIALAIGVTYRPKEDTQIDLLGKDVKESWCEKIVLNPLTQDETGILINTLIPYPILCDDLQIFVFKWSKGNPFYVIELLRQLVSSVKGYVQRVGDNWYPSPSFQENTFTNQISTFLLQRVREDSGKHFPVLQILSVVGLDLPYRLLVPLFNSNRLIPLKEVELIIVLEKLEKTGILQKSKIGSSTELEYRFSHQLIRDAVYEDIRNSVQHTFIREQLVTIIIANVYEEVDIFADQEEYYRQAARHLLYAGKENQFTQREYLLRAARVEETKQNFLRSLDYYNCFLSCSNDKDNYFERTQALIGVATILKLQGNWALAIDHLQLALNTLALEKSKNTKKQVYRLKSKILAEQGFLFIKTKEYQKADEYLSRSRLSYEGPLRSLRRYFLPHEKDFLEDLVETYLGLAEIWYRKLDISVPSGWILPVQWDVSDIYFQRAEAIAKGYGKIFSDNKLVVNVLVREGEIYSFEQRDLALDKLQKAVASMEKQITASDSDQHTMERAYSYLAEIYCEREMIEEATRYYIEARKIQEKLQDVYGLAISNGGIGDLYIEQELYSQSEYYLLEAYKYQQMVGETYRFWRTCFSLVKVYLKSNDLEKVKYYWLSARALILERILEIKPLKLEDIYKHLYALAKIYVKEKKWEDALSTCLDLQLIALDGDRLSEVDELLGEIYFKLKNPSQAIRVLYEGLEMTSDPLARADIHSLLGDICSSTKDESLKIRAEENYEECVKILMENKLEREALNIYEKLLHYMSVVKNPQRLSPLLHNLIEMMFQKHKVINTKFLEKAEKLFIQYELYKDAGDAFVHIAYKAAQIEDSGKSHGIYNDVDRVYQNELTLLEKAQDYYSKCKSKDEEISGYYKLISVYFRMDMWNEVAGCYMLIMDACMNSGGMQDVMDVLSEINMLHDKFGFDDLDELTPRIEDVEKTFTSEDSGFSNIQKYGLMVDIAKLFYHISRKADNKEIETKYLNKSLEKYDQVIVKSNEPGLMGSSYNDSALILQSMNRPDDARERLQKSIDLSISDNDRFSEACCRANFARFLQREKNFAGAKIEFEKSIGVLAGRNNYWNQRKENQDTSPLTAKEIAELRFEKKWCASVANDYGIFLYISDHSKALSLIDLAMEIFAELREDNNVQEIVKLKVMLDKMTANDRRQIAPDIFVGKFKNDFRFETSVSYAKHVTCAACGYPYDTIGNKCPSCGFRTCSNCGQLNVPQNEFCENCNTWIG